MTPGEVAGWKLRVWRCVAAARDVAWAKWEVERELERRFAAGRVRFVECGRSGLAVPYWVAIELPGERSTGVGIAVWRRRPLTRSEQRLLQVIGREALRALRALEQFGEAERRRWAVELHQGPAQELAGALVTLRLADSLFREDPEGAQKLLQEALGRVESAMRSVREAIRAFRNLREGTVTVAEALQRSWERVRPAAGARLHLELDRLDPLPPQVVEAVMTVACEAVTNAGKHSEADHVRVRIRRGRTDVTVEIDDNGRGFCARKRDQAFGLELMRECVEELGGCFAVERLIPRGTRIRAHVPLRSSRVKAAIPVGNPKGRHGDSRSAG